VGLGLIPRAITDIETTTEVVVKAFLYHVHGLGPFDFSSLRPDDLLPVQAIAAERDMEVLPTIFLGRNALSTLTEVHKAYDELREAGEVPNIAGFAVEGPLLGPLGGIPREGKWIPTVQEWESLVDLGRLGLRYIVMAPDAMALDEEIRDGFTFGDLLTRFYDNGVKVALGHFHHGDPERSARLTREVIKFLHERYESSPYLVLTDHLFNDMPRNFTHTWRTDEELVHRQTQLDAFLAHDWETSDLGELLGPVPAELLAATREGLLTPCLNFDGKHVDLEVCRLAVGYLGSDRLIALTDHIEVDQMANEKLTKAPNGLWMRNDGVVAAGSTGYERQLENMATIGITGDAATKLFDTVPRAAIQFPIRRRGA